MENYNMDKIIRGKMKTHLIIDYYNENDLIRRKELDDCLIENINCEHIDYIHIFNSTEFPSEFLSDKIILINKNERSTYWDYIMYANQSTFPNDLVILSNSDIFFDDSIKLIHTIDMKNRILALTRFCPYHGHWINEDGEIIPYANADKSQDVWIWQSPMKPMQDLKIHTGINGCDNRIAYEFMKIGYQVWNPSFSIICYHKHTQRSSNSSTNKISTPYLFVDPCTIEQVIDSEYKFSTGT